MLDTAPVAAAADHAAFVAACRDLLAAQTLVTYRPDRLDNLLPVVRGAKPVAWTWYLPEGTTDPRAVIIALCRNASHNAGYWFVGPGGRVDQWNVKGSGSAALRAWEQALEAESLVPGVDIVGREAARAALAPRLADLPFADQRLDILSGFADPTVMAALDAFAEEILARPEPVIRLADAVRLGAIHPAAFGEDPFRKKAVLALGMAGGTLAAMGRPFRLELQIAADYQIPRACAWKGLIDLDPAFREALGRDDRLLDATSDEVTALRAAAVVACHDLASSAGVEDFAVDGALFTVCRKDPAFVTEAPPAMKVGTLWF